MKILINTPFISSPAGVSNHYLGLRPYFSDDVIYNQFITGNFLRRKISISIFHKPFRVIAFIYDIIKFVALILIHSRPKILLNPSFGHNALKRDELFLNIAKFLKCKVIVFIHGWDQCYLDEVLSTGKKAFSRTWNKADAFFVLAEEFKEALSKLGINAPIYLTTTKVDDRLIENIKKINSTRGVKELLFLARVEEEKGIFITLKAFQQLNEKFPHLKLTIVGSGSKELEAKEYVKAKGIKNVVFTGPLYGKDLKTKFAEADLYILPTTHGEGMPTTVLEAMAFGLPVITRPVGGLNDFFENSKMGFLIESLEPIAFANAIKKLIENPKLVDCISGYNRKYAIENFMASQVAKSLEDTIKEV